MMNGGRRASGLAAYAEADPEPGRGLSRRRFIGYLIAAPTLVAAAQLTTGDARAAIPTVQPVDAYDLSDLLNDAAAPTSGLITVVVNTDSTVSFALPRAEVGQGITTAVAMTIADEMDLSLDQVRVTLADARPGARLEPAHRWLEHDALDLHPGPRRRLDREGPAASGGRGSARRGSG